MAWTDNIPLNFALLRNPVNWIIVAMMVLLGGLLLSFIIEAPSMSAETEE